LLKPSSFQYYRQAVRKDFVSLISLEKREKCVVSPFNIADELQERYCREYNNIGL